MSSFVHLYLPDNLCHLLFKSGNFGTIFIFASSAHQARKGKNKDTQICSFCPHKCLEMVPKEVLTIHKFKNRLTL